MESCTNLQERCDTSVYFYFARCWECDLGKYFQKRGFAGTIRADNADYLSFVDCQVDIFQCPEFFLGYSSQYFFGFVLGKFQGVLKSVGNHIAQGNISTLLMNYVLFLSVNKLEPSILQISSAS